MIKVGETMVHCLDEGSGAPILFVHGFPLDHTMWLPTANELAARFRVICPDLPGFGKSEPLNEEFTMEACADVLAAFLDELGLEKVVFCGLSMGGYIGWQFWKRHGARLLGLIAANTRAASDTEQVARARRMTAQSVQETGSRPIADAMVEKLLSPDSGDDELKNQVHQMICGAQPQSIAAGQIGMSKRVDATPWLSEINVPTLFIAGEHDGITPPDEMNSNAELVPNATLTTILLGGHLTPMEFPELFSDAVAKFVSAIVNPK